MNQFNFIVIDTVTTRPSRMILCDSLSPSNQDGRVQSFLTPNRTGQVSPPAQGRDASVSLTNREVNPVTRVSSFNRVSFTRHRLLQPESRLQCRSRRDRTNVLSSRRRWRSVRFTPSRECTVRIVRVRRHLKEVVQNIDTLHFGGRRCDIHISKLQNTENDKIIKKYFFNRLCAREGEFPDQHGSFV